MFLLSLSQLGTTCANTGLQFDDKQGFYGSRKIFISMTTTLVPNRECYVFEVNISATAADSTQACWASDQSSWTAIINWGCFCQVTAGCRFQIWHILQWLHLLGAKFSRNEVRLWLNSSPLQTTLAMSKMHIAPIFVGSGDGAQGLGHATNERHPQPCTTFD